MAAKLPRAFGRGSSSESLDQIRMERSQNPGRQAEATDLLKLLNLLEQAVQSDTPGIGPQTLEHGLLLIPVGEQGVQPLTHQRIEPCGHVLKDATLVGLANGTDQPVQAVGGRAFYLRGDHPSADPILQGRRRRRRRHYVLQ